MHGLETMFSTFEGALIGAVVCLLGSLALVRVKSWSSSQLESLTIAFICGSVTVLATIFVLDYFHRW